jgi:hypothetical protein
MSDIAEIAEGLMQMAARRSVETNFGWAHPDCQLLQEAARILRKEPEPFRDSDHDDAILAQKDKP